MTDIRVRRFSLEDEKQAKQWEDYVRREDPSSGYSLPAWLRVFKDAFGHESYPLAALRGEAVAGVLPLTHVRSALFGSLLVSLPFVNYGGILAGDPKVARRLADTARELGLALKARSVELRHRAPSGLGLPARNEHKASMILDLPQSHEALWKGFKDKVRNQVRKAQKSGLGVERGRAERLDDFYRVFCVNMRDLGTPVYSRSFFSAVLERFPRNTEILCVMRDGLPIASGILYWYGDTMQMPWASSLSGHRSSCPNHLLYWEALRLSCDAGFRHFDFGRSTPDSGPWRFKKQWGARELPLHWEYVLSEGGELPGLSVNNPKFRLAIAAWKKLPLPIANTLGPIIVRGIP